MILEELVKAVKEELVSKMKAAEKAKKTALVEKTPEAEKAAKTAEEEKEVVEEKLVKVEKEEEEAKEEEKVAEEKLEEEEKTPGMGPKNNFKKIFYFFINLFKSGVSIISNVTYENMKKEAEEDWETFKIFVKETPGWTGKFLQFLYNTGENVLYYLSYIWGGFKQFLTNGVPKKNPNKFERYFLRFPFNFAIGFSTKIERGVYNLMIGGVPYIWKLLKLPFLPLGKIWELIVYVYDSYILPGLILITTSFFAYFLRGGKEYIVSFIFGFIYLTIGAIYWVKSTLRKSVNYLSNLSDELLMESYSSVGQKIPDDILQNYFKFTPKSTMEEEFRRKESEAITLYNEDLKNSGWKYPFKITKNYALSIFYVATCKTIKLATIPIQVTITWFFSTLVLLFIIILIKWKVR